MFSKLLNKDIRLSAGKVAIAITKQDKVRILHIGTYAQNALGSSNQVPLRIVYLTDGSPGKIKIGKCAIQFKKTTPENLALREKISKLVVQALKEIGKDKATPQELEKIQKLLLKEIKQDLKHDIALAPQ